MIVGKTYAEVKSEVDAVDFDANGKPRDWLQRRYESWGLPLEPFAPIHYASVQQPSNRGHFVCVLADGEVLDPYRAGSYRLSDWPKVNQLVGLIRPCS